MRQFIYLPEHAGLTEWPQGIMRLEGVETTTDPDAADVFVIPGALTALFPDRSALERLPYFKKYEDRHTAFDCSDREQLYHTTACFIRCNVRDWYLATDPNCISWSWPVEPLSQYMALPEGGFKYDVSFQGWNWSDCRKSAIASCLATPSLKCDIQTYSDFFGYLKDGSAEQVRRRSEFLRSTRESRISLCPQSIDGVFPYRWWESLSMGRVPLLVGSGYVLPFADSIPYDEFTVKIEASSAASAGDMVAFLIGKFSDEEIQAKGEMAQHYYDKFLHRDKWPQLMALAVKQKLGVCV